MQKQVERLSRGLTQGWSEYYSDVFAVYLEHLDRVAQEAAVNLLFFLVAAANRKVTVADLDLNTLRPQVTGFAQVEARQYAESMVVNQQQEIASRIDKLSRENQDFLVAGPGKARRLVVSPSFDRSRAESAAVTAVTRAISKGEREAQKDFKRQTGALVHALWITEVDAKVCPICRPLHRKPEPTWKHLFPDGPPAHPNCRCELQWRRP